MYIHSYIYIYAHMHGLSGTVNVVGDENGNPSSIPE